MNPENAYVLMECAVSLIILVVLWHLFCLKDPQVKFDWRDGLAKPVKVFDAKGRQYRMVEWCNIETGELQYIATDRAGMILLTSSQLEILRKRIAAPAPLRIEKF